MISKKRFLVCRIVEVANTSFIELMGVLKTEEWANDYAKELGGAFVIPSVYVAN